MSNSYKFVGKLTLSSEIRKMEYLIISKTERDYRSQNITNILDEIYSSPSPFISVMIKTLGDSIKIIHTGELNIKKDKYGIHTYHIDNFCLEDELFDLVGSQIEIHIKHLEENEIKKEKKVLEEES